MSDILRFVDYGYSVGGTATWTDTGGGSEIHYWIDNFAFNADHSILYAGVVDHGVWAYDGVNWTDTGKVGITPELLSAENQSFEGGTVGDWFAYDNATIDNSTDWASDGTHSLRQVAIASGDSYAALMVTPVTMAGQSYTATVQVLTTVGITAWIYLADETGATPSSTFVGDGNFHTFTVTRTRARGSAVMSLGVAMTATTGDVQYIDSASLTVAGYEILALAYDTVNSVIYAGLLNPWTQTYFGVWKYSGGVWTDTGGGLSTYNVQSLALDSTSTYLYAGTMLHGVWKYNISTSTWSDTGGGLSGYFPQSLAYDSVHNVLYASCSDSVGTGQGVWKYDIGTTTWTCISPQNTSHVIFSLAYDSVHNLLYAGGFIPATGIGYGVWVCTTPNTAPVWTNTGGGVSAHSIRNIVYDPDHNILYAGSSFFFTETGHGVWKYDGIWTDIGGGLSGYVVDSIIYDSVLDMLYAGTGYHGIWKCYDAAGILDTGFVLLDINDGEDYCFDEIEFPTPKPRIEWRDPAHSDGRDPSFVKYENRIVTIHMHVFGTDEDDLAANIQALWEQFLADSPILEWKADGWTDSLYLDLISPPIEINTPDWFESVVRDNGQVHVLSNIELVLEAKPFLRGPEETVVLLTGAVASPDVVNCVQGIVVPPASFKGDVPAPADIFIDLVDGTLWTDLIFGQREKYSAAFDPIQEPTVGTLAYDADRLNGDYRTLAAFTDLLDDGIFAQHGATSGNTTDWDHWAETRTGTNAWMSTEGAPVFTGTHCVKVGCSNPTGPFSLILASDSVAITTSKTYFASFVYGYQSRASLVGERVYVYLNILFYNGGAFLGSKYLGVDPSVSLSSWDFIAGYVTPADFNAYLPTVVTHIKVQVYLYSDWYPQYTYSLQALYAYFGQAIFAECVGGAVQAEYPLDSHEGRYLPVGAVSFDATNVNDNVTFQAMLATSAGVEITPSINPMTIDTGDPNTCFAEVAMLNSRLPVITIPTHLVSSFADKSNIEQIIRLATSPLNLQAFWYDYIGIVPIDRAYAEVRNWTGNHHLILDGRSSNLALTSLTGTLDDAQVYDMNKQKSECSFVADPNGFNGAIMAVRATACGSSFTYDVASTVDVTMVYSPLYLLVPEG